MKRLIHLGLLGPVLLLSTGVAGCTAISDGTTPAEPLRMFIADLLRQALAAYVL